MSSHMQRTRAVLKKRGIINQIVERYFPKSRKYPFGCKEDFLNIIDLIALDDGILGIQICGSDYQSHVRKIREQKTNTIAWLENGGRFEIHSWRKYLKKRGGKAKEWKCKITDVLLHDGEIYFEERG